MQKRGKGLGELYKYAFLSCKGPRSIVAFIKNIELGQEKATCVKLL